MDTQSVILTGPASWKDWYAITKGKSTSGRVSIWKYIDPESIAIPDQPQKPDIPVPIGDAEDVSKMVFFNYRQDLETYNMEIALINAMMDYIRSHVSRLNFSYIRTDTTPYAALQSLKRMLAPTDNAMKEEIAQKYRQLCENIKNQEIEQYIHEWETTYADAVELKLNEIQGDKAQEDFIYAITPRYPEFADAQDIIFSRLRSNGESLPSFSKITHEFRDYARHKKAKAIRRGTQKPGTHGAFATSSSTPLIQNSNDKFMGESRGNSSKDVCVCGAVHALEKCWYLNPLNKPKSFKLRQEKYDRINEALRKDTRLQDQIQNSTGYSINSSSNAPDLPTSSSSNRGTFATSFHSSTDKSNSSNIYYNSWMLDGCSNCNVINEAGRSEWVKTREAQPHEELRTGAATLKIEAFGTAKIWINTPSGKAFITLTNVALVPGNMCNIICTSVLARKGICHNTKNPEILQHNDGSIFCHLQRQEDLWALETGVLFTPANQFPHSTQTAFAAQKSTEPRKATFTGLEIHQILGHASPEAISKLAHTNTDVTIDNSKAPCPDTATCEVCRLSKATRQISRSTDKEDPAIRPFDRLQYDIVEFSEAYNGDKFASHIVCSFSGYHFVITHKRKSDATSIILQIIRLIQRKFTTKVRFFQTDGEKSLASEFELFLEKEGISLERSAPYTQAQNGGAERAGRSLVVQSRSKRIQSHLPDVLWNEAIMHSGYTANRVPLRKIQWQTPLQFVYKWYSLKEENSTLRLAHLHPFGCKAYILDHKVQRKDKLQPRAYIGYFVGFNSTNIFRLWIPDKKKVVFARDVQFDHTQFYNPLDEQEDIEIIGATNLQLPLIAHSKLQGFEDIFNFEDSDDDVFDDVDDVARIEASTNRAENDAIAEKSANQESHQLATPSPTPTPEHQPQRQLSLPQEQLQASTTLQARIRANQRWAIQRELAERPGNHEGNTAQRGNEINADIDENAIIHTKRTRPGRNTGFFTAFMSSVQGKEERDNLPPPPKSWKQMERHKLSERWKEATTTEFNTLMAKGTFQYTIKNLAQDQKDHIQLMWVWSYKFDVNGFLNKCKARLCARGDLQSTEQETYAATLAAQTFRAMMAIIAAFNLETRSFDVINAFVNGDLVAPLVARCPDGYSKENYNLTLTKALYGLKESAAIWYNHITNTLRTFGLNPVPGVNCLFTSEWMILMLYVDDIIIAYDEQYHAKAIEFERKLTAAYEIRALGEADHFLGIRIIRDRQERKLWLVQDAYISSLAAKFHVPISPPLSRHTTPLPQATLVQNPGKASEAQTLGYQQKIGSLNFPAVFTRPDIARSISKLSEFLQNPSELHLNAADHLIIYIINTRFMAIEFDGNTEESFQAFSDAAFADNVATRYSSFGFFFSLYGGAIHWKATKQKHVTTSSTEAELGALNTTAKEFMWWIRLFGYIQLQFQAKPYINCDNKQTLRLLQQDTPKLETKLKHIDIIQSWLRQEVQIGRIDVDWIPTKDMKADGFTKELSPQKHAQFIQQLRLKDVENMITKS
jgi:Reverse transcriptase (RNA-dependent DNA polymerase)